MAFLRGFFLVLVSVLLFFSLISVTFLWTVSSSLEYPNIEKQSVIVIESFLIEDTNLSTYLSAVYPTMSAFCKNNSEYVFLFEGTVFNIPCQSVLQGQDAILESAIKNQVHKIYYTSYDCNFLDCFSKNPIPFFLISEKAYQYWTNNLYIFLAISAVLSGLLLLLVKKKTNMMVIFGILLIISSLLFIKLDLLFNLFSNKLIGKILRLFFSQSYSVSINLLLTGATVLIAGIAIKAVKTGFSVEQVLSKFKKPEAKNSQKIQKKKSK